MKMRLSKKRLLIIVLTVAVVGLAYLIIGLLYAPDLARFQVTGIMDGGRTEYRPGERITVEPFLAYTGIIPATIHAGIPLFFADVYTAENEKVLQLPVLDGVLIPSILFSHTLSPNVPFNDEDRWRGVYGTPVGHPILDYLGAYSFRLEHTGSYKVVVRAEFSRRVGETVYTVYSEPILVQIHGWP